MEQYALVYFPNTDLNKINLFREKYDPNYHIISSHITIVSPVSNISENQLIEHVETITKDIKSFSIHLNDLNKSFDDYLFLLVNEGKEKIVNLHDKLYSGILLPYLQNDIPFVPHITLGFFKSKNNQFDDGLYKKAYAQAEELNLDINCIFDSLSLIKGDGITPSKIVQAFDLK